MGALLAAWRMVAHHEKRTADRLDAFDQTNRAEHAELLKAIHGLGERIANMEGKIDVLIDLQRGGAS